MDSLSGRIFPDGRSETSSANHRNRATIILPALYERGAEIEPLVDFGPGAHGKCHRVDFFPVGVHRYPGMHILILDDEPPAARRVQRLVQEFLPEAIQSLKLLHAVEPAIYYLQEHPVDLVFLDLEIADNSGFELLQNASAHSFDTIIVSGHPEGAVQAFEHEVIDFVTKPVMPERFQKALARLKTARSSRGVQRRSISLPGEEATEIVDLDSIETITSDGNYSIIETYEGNHHRVRKTLTSLESELERDFLRTHKTCLVRRSDLMRILSAANNTYLIELKSGKRMPLGRSAREKLRSGEWEGCSMERPRGTEPLI